VCYHDGTHGQPSSAATTTITTLPMCCKSSSKVVEMAITLQHHVASNRTTKCHTYAVVNLSVKSGHVDIRQLILRCQLYYSMFTSHLHYFQKKFSLFRIVFSTRVVHVEYVLAKVALGEYFSEHLNFPLPNIIPPTLHTHVPYQSDTSAHHEATVPGD